MIRNTHSTLLLILTFTFYSLSALSQNFNELLQKADEQLYANPKQSAFYAQKAFNKIADIDSVHKVKALIAFGLANLLQGDFDQSIKSYYEAMDYMPKGNKQQEALVNVRLSMVYCSLKDFPKAFELNDKATAIYKSRNDSTGIALCYNTRGIIHYNLNEYSTADKFFKNAANINRLLKDWKALAANINNQSLYQGNTEEKIKLLHEAIDINKKLNAVWSLAENHNNLGRQYYFAHRYPEAIAILQKARTYALEIGAKGVICDNYEYQSMVYAAQKNYPLAYTNLLNLYKTQEALLSDKRLRNIEREVSDRRYLLQKKETELRQQAYKIEILKRNLAILITVLSSLVVLLFFGIKWYKRKKNLQLMETNYQLEQSQREVAELKISQQEVTLESMSQKLDSAKQELTSFAMFLHSRNELLGKIKDQIKDGYKLEGTSLVGHLKKMNTFISQCQQNEEGATAIFENIEIKNRDYIKRLTTRHPDLTQGEKHLATFLRVNLSTKEISLLTGSIPKTINMNRYRLRKHL
ncbi:MAG: LuxR family transcriptional regulator, partial [Bacteroidaceae bacterium]